MFGFRQNIRGGIPADNHGLFLMNFFNSSGYIVGELRNYRTHNYTVDTCRINIVSLIHHHKLYLKFIAGSVRFGIQNPGNIAIIVLEKTKTDVGIANIYHNSSHYYLFSTKLSSGFTSANRWEKSIPKAAI